MSVSTKPSHLWHRDQCQEDQANEKQGMDRSFRQSQAASTWAVITDEGSKPEILSRIAQAAAALTRLKPVWIDKSISLCSKIRLMRYLVISIILYVCESWTLTGELQRRIQAMEMRCYRKILHISYKTMLPTRKSVPRSSRQLDHTKTYLRP